MPHAKYGPNQPETVAMHKEQDRQTHTLSYSPYMYMIIVTCVQCVSQWQCRNFPVIFQFTHGMSSAWSCNVLQLLLALSQSAEMVATTHGDVPNHHSTLTALVSDKQYGHPFFV